MTRLESKPVSVNKPNDEVFAFFQDFTNYKALMPSSVDRFDATADTCEISIQKMGSLPMKIVRRTVGESIFAEKNGSALFDFTFEVKTTKSGDKTQLQMILNADLNPMLKILAQKPLVGFLNILLDRYLEKFV